VQTYTWFEPSDPTIMAEHAPLHHDSTLKKRTQYTARLRYALADNHRHRPPLTDTARHSPTLTATELVAEWRSGGVSVKIILVNLVNKIK